MIVIKNIIKKTLYFACVFLERITCGRISILSMYQGYKKNLINEPQLYFFKQHADITTLKPAIGKMRQTQLNNLSLAQSLMEETKELNITPFLVNSSLLGAVRHKGFIPWNDTLNLGIMRHEFDTLKLSHKILMHMPTYAINASTEEILNYKDALLKQHPHTIILLYQSGSYHIIKGSSIDNMASISLFVYDYYPSDYTEENYIEDLKHLKNQELLCTSYEEINTLYQEACQRFSIQEDNSQIFYGLDTHATIKNLTSPQIVFSPKDHFFPLQMIPFEGHMFYAHAKLTTILSMQYGNYMIFPHDIIPAEKQPNPSCQTSNHTVEFFVLLSQEIKYYLPLYKALIQKNIPCRMATSQHLTRPLEYDRIIKEFEANAIFDYKTQITPDVRIVFTTQLTTNISSYKKSHKILVPYGISFWKNTHYSSIKRYQGFDTILLHGSFSENLLSPIKCRKIIIGYQTYDLHKPHKSIQHKLKEELNIKTDKPILIYAPTWCSFSSIPSFYQALKTLRNDYFIITKPHPGTILLENETYNRKVLYAVSDIVLNIFYPTPSFALLGDVALCDAKSGILAEIPYLNPNIKLIATIPPHINKNFYFHDTINSYASIIQEPSELKENIQNIHHHDPYIATRKEITKTLFKKDTTLYEFTEHIHNILDNQSHRKE